MKHVWKLCVLYGFACACLDARKGVSVSKRVFSLFLDWGLRRRLRTGWSLTSLFCALDLRFRRAMLVFDGNIRERSTNAQTR